MKKLFVLVAVLFVVLLGCTRESQVVTTETELDLHGNKLNEHNEVVNIHGEIKNIGGLVNFVKNVNDQSEDQLTYIQHGIEGQRGVLTLTFNGGQINVTHRVDGNFIEEYNCEGVAVERKEGREQYILTECSGSFNGNFELLSIPK